VYFTLDTKKDDTCYNHFTTSTPKQKKRKTKKGSDERGKIGQVESALFSWRFTAVLTDNYLTSDLKCALNARHSSLYNKEDNKKRAKQILSGTAALF